MKNLTIPRHMEDTKPWLIEMITYIFSFIGGAGSIGFFYFKFKKIELEANVAKEVREEELKKINQKEFIKETLDVLLKTPLYDIDQNIKQLSTHVVESHKGTLDKISKLEDRITDTNKRIDKYIDEK